MVERTCVVCRKTAEKYSLLRFVLANATQSEAGVRLEKNHAVDGGTLVFDGSATRSGRGAYCHPQCLSQVTGRMLCRSLAKHKQGSMAASCEVVAIVQNGLQEVRSPELKAQIQRALEAYPSQEKGGVGRQRGKWGIRL